MYRFKKILTLSIFAIFLIFVSGCGNSKNLLLGEWNAEKDIDVNDIVKFDNDKMTVNGKKYNFNIKSIKKRMMLFIIKLKKMVSYLQFYSYLRKTETLPICLSLIHQII